MFGYLSRLFGSFGRLADNLDALSTTTAEVNTRLRSQLQLDGPADAPRVIEHRPDDEADAKPSRRREKATA